MINKQTHSKRVDEIHVAALLRYKEINQRQQAQEEIQKRGGTLRDFLNRLDQIDKEQLDYRNEQRRIVEEYMTAHPDDDSVVALPPEQTRLDYLRTMSYIEAIIAYNKTHITVPLGMKHFIKYSYLLKSTPVNR